MDNRLNPGEIEIRMRKSARQLQDKNEEMKRLAVKKARTENVYRVELAKEILRLKPIYPATLISDLARGNEQIAKLKQDRDIAEMMYDIAKQKAYDLREEIGIMRSLLTQQRAELENS